MSEEPVGGMSEPTPLYRAIGSRVLRARIDAGMTQDQLAEKIGMARASIANLEAGRQRPPVHVIADIAAALGVPRHDLIPEAGFDVPVKAVKPQEDKRFARVARDLESVLGRISELSGTVDESASNDRLCRSLALASCVREPAGRCAPQLTPQSTRLNQRP
jgi:transcriptional regulator with XRE-family HTH domain